MDSAESVDSAEFVASAEFVDTGDTWDNSGQCSIFGIIGTCEFNVEYNLKRRRKTCLLVKKFISS